MELLSHLGDLILHLDKHLAQLTSEYGPYTLAILFLIVFSETGLVVLPFLPGDSLLFAAGAIAAQGQLNLAWLLGLLAIAAIAGDAVNYAVGKCLGPRVLRPGQVPWIRAEHIERTQRFYEKHGKLTIVLARFVPIVRTFAPFLAGVGTMRYLEFAVYNITGGLAWVGLFVTAGFLFGNVPTVKSNFTLVILGIVAVSLLPIVLEFWRSRRATPANRQP